MEMLSRLIANICIGCDNSHGLLAHSTLESILGGLVMVCKRDRRSTDSKHHRRMDFAVSIVQFAVRKLTKVHSD